MLFGRKKPGFIPEEELTEEPEASGKPELLEYVQSLPEVEDTEFADEPMPPEDEADAELTEAMHAAEYIRLRTRGIELTPRSALLEEIECFQEIQKEWETEESCADIVFIRGNKDDYYYSSQFMSDNYAMISSLVLEKDLPRTIAVMVRFNCKTYPIPTPCNYFERSPYLYSEAQIARALDVIQSEKEYQDIQTLKNNMGDLFLYSTEHMSRRYAKALADVDEYTD